MAKPDVGGPMDKRERLEKRRAVSFQLTAKLEEQRKSLLVGAHIGDEGAKEKLQKVNTELQAATRDLFDIADAIEQIDREIIALEAAEKLAARQQQRESLRALLQARINDQRESRVVGLLLKLDSELSEMQASTKAIALSLRAFSPRLDGVVTNLQGREGLAADNLRGNGLRAGGGFVWYAKDAQSLLANIVRILDRIEEETAVR